MYMNNDHIFQQSTEFQDEEGHEVQEIFLLQQMCNPARTGAKTSLKSLELNAQQEPNQVTQ